jgi:hypothetical protein
MLRQSTAENRRGRLSQSADVFVRDRGKRVDG